MKKLIATISCDGELYLLKKIIDNQFAVNIRKEDFSHIAIYVLRNGICALMRKVHKGYLYSQSTVFYNYGHHIVANYDRHFYYKNWKMRTKWKKLPNLDEPVGIESFVLRNRYLCYISEGEVNPEDDTCMNKIVIVDIKMREKVSIVKIQWEYKEPIHIQMISEDRLLFYGSGIFGRYIYIVGPFF